jgi:hypothetical protein
LDYNLNERFQEFKSQEPHRRLFLPPFNTEVYHVPEKLQVEPLELQGDVTLKQNSHQSSLPDFYNSLPKDEFPQLVEFANNELSLFGSTYKCEPLFSRIKFTKSETQSRLTHL